MTETIQCHDCNTDVETTEIESETFEGGGYVLATYPCGHQDLFPQTPAAPDF